MIALNQLKAMALIPKTQVWVRGFSTTSIVDRWHESKVANRMLRNHGYEDNLRRTGPLPRLSNDDDKLKAQPVYTPFDPFAPKRALWGQNDYIDILGDETIHPVDTHYHIPEWLRGYRSNIYVKFLIRKVNHLEESGMKYAFPHDWNELVRERDRLLHKVNRQFNQKRYTNYRGLKYGDNKNVYKTRYPF